MRTNNTHFSPFPPLNNRQTKKKKNSWIDVYRSRGRKVKFASDVTRYIVAAQLALELFGRLGACAGSAGLDIPVDLVEWLGSSRGGLRGSFGKFGWMRRVRERKKVRMV
jgi:hypothetical protein